MEIPSCATEDLDLIFKGEYEVPMREDPKTILDLGANCGIFSAWAKSRWPDAKIIAYEPWRENAELFRKNLPDVELREVAVRSQSGVFKMRADRNPLCRTFTTGSGPSRNIHCVDARTLPKCEFVKIDTEGCEFEILSRMNLSKTKAISLEAHTPYDANRITHLLVDKGFALNERKDSVNGCLLLKFVRRSTAYPQKLFVAIPTYGNSPSGFWECLMKLQSQIPCNLAIKTLNGDSLVARARNTLTAQFLETDCTDMLFIDSDLMFSADHIKRILNQPANVVGGFYPKKQDGKLAWVCNAIAKEKPDKYGLQRVRYMGTGFMRIKRCVFEQMISKLGKSIRYRTDSLPRRTEYDLWPVGPYQFKDGTSRYLSEDWYFCQRWLDLGGKVYGDTQIVLRHIGHAVYPLLSQMSQIANPDGVPPEATSDTALTDAT